MKALKHPEQEFVTWGKGDATRSYCYIDDCIEMVLRLMDSNYDKPINIGSDRLISVDDLTNLVIKIAGKNITPKHDLSKPEGVKGRNADLTLAKEVLKWTPQVTLEDGLARVYKWAEEHYNELEGI
jgi:nucleoside-diphosphate-sugar epimerase